MRRVRRIAVPATIALALAAGVVLLLLAHDVRVWHRTIDRATAQTTRHPASPWSTSAGTVLPRFASADLAVAHGLQPLADLLLHRQAAGLALCLRDSRVCSRAGCGRA